MRTKYEERREAWEEERGRICTVTDMPMIPTYERVHIGRRAWFIHLIRCSIVVV